MTQHGNRQPTCSLVYRWYAWAEPEHNTESAHCSAQPAAKSDAAGCLLSSPAPGRSCDVSMVWCDLQYMQVSRGGQSTIAAAQSTFRRGVVDSCAHLRAETPRLAPSARLPTPGCAQRGRADGAASVEATAYQHCRQSNECNGPPSAQHAEVEALSSVVLRPAHGQRRAPTGPLRDFTMHAIQGSIARCCTFICLRSVDVSAQRSRSMSALSMLGPTSVGSLLQSPAIWSVNSLTIFREAL